MANLALPLHPIRLFRPLIEVMEFLLVHLFLQLEAGCVGSEERMRYDCSRILLGRVGKQGQKRERGTGVRMLVSRARKETCA
jgi:hypothetical protein